jgi:DNA-binding NarL/FixJ family response regulator
MSEEHNQITILLVDDHTLLREALREILDRQEDLRVVGEADDGRTTLTLAAAEQPDVILLDVEIPDSDVATTVKQISERSPGSRVIILSMYEGPQLVQALLAVGIRGYLLKSSHWQELVTAIRAVHTSDRIILGVSRESLGHVPPHLSPRMLTPRELEVLDLVANALSNSQIATRLHLTEATVKRHLRNIFIKLEAVSRLDAVNKAREWQQRQFAEADSGAVDVQPRRGSVERREKALIAVGPRRRKVPALSVSSGPRVSPTAAYRSTTRAAARSGESSRMVVGPWRRSAVRCRRWMSSLPSGDPIELRQLQDSLLKPAKR